MSQLTLCGDCYSDATVVSNQFIDDYMKDANDAQIKIYLYLLRCNAGNLPVSVSLIADCFNYTEKDVIRALKYWEKQKLISLTFDGTKHLTGIRLLPLFKPEHTNEGAVMMTSAVECAVQTVPAVTASSVSSAAPAVPETTSAKVFKLPTKPSYSLDKLAAFKSQPDISQLLFIAEQYLNKTLSSNEISSILYMYDSLGFNADLIEYLIEYCVNNKKKSIRFIETIANSWAAADIHSVEEAKMHTSNFPKEVYEVFRAFGINCNRTPVEPEIAYVRRWTDSLGFSMDIIAEACSRTVMSIHNPSFEYADTILTNWFDSGVRHFSDIEKRDEQFHSSKPSVKKIVSAKTSANGTAKDAVPNKFNNFSQRTYNYSELEREILSN